MPTRATREAAVALVHAVLAIAATVMRRSTSDFDWGRDF